MWTMMYNGSDLSFFYFIFVVILNVICSYFQCADWLIDCMKWSNKTKKLEGRNIQRYFALAFPQLKAVVTELSNFLVGKKLILSSTKLLD